MPMDREGRFHSVGNISFTCYFFTSIRLPVSIIDLKWNQSKKLKNSNLSQFYIDVDVYSLHSQLLFKWEKASQTNYFFLSYIFLIKQFQACWIQTCTNPIQDASSWGWTEEGNWCMEDACKHGCENSLCNLNCCRC